VLNHQVAPGAEGRKNMDVYRIEIRQGDCKEYHPHELCVIHVSTPKDAQETALRHLALKHAVVIKEGE
jgi:hypothetical protein